MLFTDFRERERKIEIERDRQRDTEREASMWERNIDQLPPVCALTGDGNVNLFGVWDDAPTNWATQPGPSVAFKNWCSQSLFTPRYK